MRKLLAIFALLFPAFAFGQYTAVSARIVDANGGVYANCSFNAIFVGQSSQPGPYLISGSVFAQSIDGARCDSSGNITVRVATNSAVSPTPSQWQFNFCDQTGKYCGQTQLAISGSTQDISSALTAVAPILPSTGSAGYNRIQDEGSNLTQRNILNFAGALIACVDNSGQSRTDCTITAGAAYSTVQDEGTPLTQRAMINFTGAGITCSDIASVTTCNVSAGGGGITGTLTSGTLPVASGATTVIDSHFFDDGSFASICNTSGCNPGPKLQMGIGASGGWDMRGAAYTFAATGAGTGSGNFSFTLGTNSEFFINGASANAPRFSLNGGTSGAIKLTTDAAAQSASLNLSHLLQDCQGSTTCSPIVMTHPAITKGRVALTAGTATITAISPAFASTTSPVCFAMDTTTPASVVTVTIVSTSSITLTGIGTDQVNYACLSN